MRLVHFGDKDNIPNFKFADGFFAEASWTVPSGRNFRYQGNMTLEGDLWLQKGSLMAITGDLVLNNPDPSSSSPLKPSGKIVIEEGASLIVTGSITAAGDPRFGSLWACTPPKHLAPVTSAIMAGKSITLPYGSYSATNLQDAAMALGSTGLADALDTATVQMAPNLSKVSGPFHTRQPFFASYATTFQLTIVPTPFGPVPIPTPIPLPKTNILVPLFRTLTMLYTGSLNMAIGENLYLHSDWWPYGQGVVPAMIKLDPAGPMNALKNLNLGVLNPNIDWGDTVQNLTENLLKGAAEFAIKTVGQALVKEVMASVVPGGSLLSGLLDTLLEKIDTKGNALENFQEQMVQATFGPVLNQLNDVRRKIEDEVKAALAESYLREVGGPLIYADSIKVGDGSTRPLLMSGMLVAENNIDIDSESFVGSLTSLHGNITAGKVYFTPLFTRASFYRPKSAGSTALARVSETGYGDGFDSGLAVDVGTGVWQVTTEGWAR